MNWLDEFLATTAAAIDPPPPDGVVRLKSDDVESALAFLQRSPIENVVMIDHLRTEGITGFSQNEFVGVREGDAWLGLMYVQGDIAMYAPDERAIAPLARYAMQRNPLVPRIIGRAETVGVFWEVFGTLGRPLQFDRMQVMYLLEPADNRGQVDVRVRAATVDELDKVSRLASAMAVEEIGMDPLYDFPLGFRRLVETRLVNRRYWVLVEDGEIKFQVLLDNLTPDAAMVTGVYTPPQYRGQGYGRIGMGAFCCEALKLAPCICLFVNDFNVPARKIYENLGFKAIYQNRAIFAEP